MDHKKFCVCKCQYLSVTFAKILVDLKMIEKHKTRKNQQTFCMFNMCNNTIKIIINTVDEQGLAKNYYRQIQGQTNFRSTFVMLQKMRDDKFCDVTLASADGQKFKAHKVMTSASSIFFKKLLVNNLNHYSLYS